MQRHESDARAQDALLFDAGQLQEFSEIDVVSLTSARHGDHVELRKCSIGAWATS
jgi:hypothetical protein